MSDLTSTSWAELDASNNQSSPEGWPTGMFPNGVEPSARMNMGALKRHFNRINPVYPTTQTTTDAYVITPTQALVGYGLYEHWRARFNIANNSTSPTINISALGPLNFVKYSNGSKVALAAGDIQAQDHGFWYDGAGNAVLTNPAGVTNLSATTNTALAFSAATGAVVAAFKPSLLPAKAAPTSSDSVVITDATQNNAPLTALLSAVAASIQQTGTWTPSLQFGGAAVSMTYGTQSGDFVKIGNLVIATFDITLTAKGSSTGNASIAGLPFTVHNSGPAGGTGGIIANYANLASLTGAPGTQGSANGTTLSINQTGAAGSASLTEANFTNTSTIIGNLVYYT